MSSRRADRENRIKKRIKKKESCGVTKEKGIKGKQTKKRYKD